MNTAVHPKVKAGGVGAALATVLFAVLTAFGVELSPIVVAAVTSVSTLAAAFLKSAEQE